MILSVSRRTDIPAFYPSWFMNRLHEGYVCVRNPMNYHQVSKVILSPSVIDCIVFWTKNPAPLLPYLDEIGSQYPYYFQFTLNAYQSDIEPNLQALEKRIDTFYKLSSKTGSKRVIWRYDPILLTNKYTIDWHIIQFENMAKALNGYADECVFSFVDIYDKVKNNVSNMGVRGCNLDECDIIAQAFSKIARENKLRLRTCAESIDLQKYGIEHGCCIDGNLIAEITGWELKAKKDPNQRQECGCIESVDIGQYNTCRHGCKYCYANFNPQAVENFSKKHNPLSPFLIGDEEAEDKITERKMKLLRDKPAGQISMF